MKKPKSTVKRLREALTKIASLREDRAHYGFLTAQRLAQAALKRKVRGRV
jgi:hypothetical protein